MGLPLRFLLLLVLDDFFIKTSKRSKKVGTFFALQTLGSWHSADGKAQRTPLLRNMFNESEEGKVRGSIICWQ